MLLSESYSLNPSLQLYRQGRINTQMLLALLRERMYEQGSAEREDLVRGYALVAIRSPGALSENDLKNAFFLVLGSIEQKTGFRYFTNPTYSLLGELVAEGLRREERDVFMLAVKVLLELTAHGLEFKVTNGIAEGLAKARSGSDEERRTLATFAALALEDAVTMQGIVKGRRRTAKGEARELLKAHRELLFQIEMLDALGFTHELSKPRKVARRVRNVAENPFFFREGVRKAALAGIRDAMPLMLRPPVPKANMVRLN